MAQQPNVLYRAVRPECHLYFVVASFAFELVWLSLIPYRRSLPPCHTRALCTAQLFRILSPKLVA